MPLSQSKDGIRTDFYLACLHVHPGGGEGRTLPFSWLCDGNNKGGRFHFPKGAFQAPSGEALAACFSQAITFSVSFSICKSPGKKHTHFGLAEVFQLSKFPSALVFYCHDELSGKALRYLCYSELID